MTYIDKINLFATYSPALDALTMEQKSNLYGLIWSYREGALSVCVKTKDRNTLLSITNGIGSGISEGGIYGVDLESLTTDKIRIYVDPRKSYEEPVILTGYYLGQDGVFYEYKNYYKDSDANIIIKRYDVQDNLLSTETEFPATQSDWKGPSDLITIADVNNIAKVFQKKGEKDQCYLTIRFDVDSMNN